MDTATPDFRGSAMLHVERRRFRRISYPFGVMLNRRGERFVDEGADFRNYTYAQYGAAVLEQPSAVAWQIFDTVGAKLLYDDYFQESATHWQAPRLSELIDQLPGIDRSQAMQTLDAYNASASGEGFDPAIKDGCATRGSIRPRAIGRRPLRNLLFTPSKSLAASPSPTADWQWMRTDGCSMSAARPFQACLRRVNWSAACSSMAIPAAPA